MANESRARDAIIAELLGDVGMLEEQIRHLPLVLEKSVSKYVREGLPGEASQVIDRAASNAVEMMSSQVVGIAQQIAGDTAAAERYKAFWVAAIGVLACAVTFGGAGFVVRMSVDKLSLMSASSQLEEANARVDEATEVAEIRADQEIADIKKRAGWAGTKEGLLAKKFFESGAGAIAASCNSPTWEVVINNEGKYCVPKRRPIFGNGEEQYGWKIP